MKKCIIFTVLIFLVICIIIAYKLSISGNNISKSDDKDILNISSYEAVIEVQVYSNKNTNKYILNQRYAKPNIFRQEVIEPENVKGLVIKYDGINLTLENNKLGLKNTYEDYNVINSNSLSLISFIEEYKESKEVKIEETENEKIIKIKVSGNNKYESYKKLYIGQKTNIPIKIEVLDVNENITVYILYKEIKLNNTSKEKVLAD